MCVGDDEDSGVRNEDEDSGEGEGKECDCSILFLLIQLARIWNPCWAG